MDPNDDANKLLLWDIFNCDWVSSVGASASRFALRTTLSVESISTRAEVPDAVLFSLVSISVAPSNSLEEKERNPLALDRLRCEWLYDGRRNTNIRRCTDAGLGTATSEGPLETVSTKFPWLRDLTTWINVFPEEMSSALVSLEPSLAMSKPLKWDLRRRWDWRARAIARQNPATA
ncbi:hypothetical protein BaOVIS_010560 [Babesia ovis]|uniref:Uncharacterized protein n=1 Tax=Babesia ovis TaxID=5869 RepID=A0A9W5WUW0_BABOV|nr:hypothetical protein BaOVIS_010560 [Babesia ovis]